MTVRPTKPLGESTDGRSPERYLDGRELAHLMGVSLSTVKRLAAAGMPSVVWGQRSRRYLASEAIAWAKVHGTKPSDDRTNDSSD